MLYQGWETLVGAPNPLQRRTIRGMVRAMEAREEAAEQQKNAELEKILRLYARAPSKAEQLRQMIQGLRQLGIHLEPLVQERWGTDARRTLSPDERRTGAHPSEMSIENASGLDGMGKRVRRLSIKQNGSNPTCRD
jgi:hypothetical protein